MNVYTIPKLEWKRRDIRCSDGFEGWYAETALGDLCIWHTNGDGFSWGNPLNDDDTPVKSFDAAKHAAKQWFRSRLEAALRPLDLTGVREVLEQVDADASYVLLDGQGYHGTIRDREKLADWKRRRDAELAALAALAEPPAEPHYDFTCPRCGGHHFGRDTKADAIGIVVLDTVRCHNELPNGKPCWWHGPWAEGQADLKPEGSVTK